MRFPGGELEVLDIPGENAAQPLVLMHGGLGSAGLWDEFPYALAQRTGRRTVAFSRHGHGSSEKPPKPRTPSFMHEEAREVLPEFLARLQLHNPVLIGHSDGASIALIYAAERPGVSGGGGGVGRASGVHAGAGRRGAVAGIVAIAPHVFVEQKCVDEIARARDRYTSSDLRDKMAPHHKDVDAAFFGWCDVWLDPDFRSWDIRDKIPHITAPMLLIQGVEDQFGTLAQLDEIERLARTHTTRVQLDCRHAPFVQKPEETLEAVTRFVTRSEARLAV